MQCVCVLSHYVHMHSSGWAWDGLHLLCVCVCLVNVCLSVDKCLVQCALFCVLHMCAVCMYVLNVCACVLLSLHPCACMLVSFASFTFWPTKKCPPSAPSPCT